MGQKRGPAQLKILHYDSLESTNTTARRLAEKGAPEWTVVVSEVQTKGRGRNGRNWISPRGGLWLSILLRPAGTVEYLGILQFLIGSIVCEVIEDYQIPARTKWPNDIVVESGKLAGILIETKVTPLQVVYAIIGLGVNVNIDQALLPEEATSISTLLGRSVDRENLLQNILEKLNEEYEQQYENDKIVADWWDKCIHRNRLVQVDLEGKTIQGVNTGLSNLGQLILKTRQADLIVLDEGTLRINPGQL